MKKAYCIILVVLYCSFLKAFEKDRIDTFEQLSKEFETPSSQYRSIPLYVWDYDLDRDLIKETMKDLRNVGCGGVLIHPRPGLITEYLSDEWYDLYGYTIELAKEYGMKVWIYDENSYPSGFAGGHVPAEMPKSYNQGQGLIMEKCSILSDSMSNVFLCLEEKGGKFKDVTLNMDSKKGILGNYFLFRKTFYPRNGWYAGYSYVDLLAPGVTDKFIDITMSGYEERFGHEFGKTIEGVFTDEPHISSPKGMRWTPDLFREFQKVWGYDLKEYLPALFENVGDWKKVRHNYFSTLLNMFVDRWSTPWRKYCDEKGLKWTGHYWEHRWPDIRNGGDDMAMYTGHHIPAIDLLFNLYNESTPNNQFGNIRIVREVNSVANQMGSSRVLCEMYGGGGWEETFNDFKRLGDWAYALGINQMNQHLSRITLTGARKYDYPTSFSYHEPWWKYYHYMNDYQARLSVALSSGIQKNNILVLKPTSTGWLYYIERKISNELKELGQSFQDFVTCLEKEQVTYDIGSEYIIKQYGSVRSDHFIIGQADYNIVVIPPKMENLDSFTFNLLKEFVKNSGRVVAFSKPGLLDGERSSEMESFFSNNNSIVYEDSLSSELINTYLGSNSVVFNNVFGGNLYRNHRKLSDGELLFLVNSDRKESVTGEFFFSDVKYLYEMDAFTGVIKKYSGQKRDNNSWTFSIPPSGSLLLWGSPEKVAAESSILYTETEMVVQPQKTEVKRNDLNVLTLDYCNLYVGDKLYKDIHIFDASDKVYKSHGFKSNPWNSEIQFKKEICNRDTFTTGGFTADYEFYVNGKIDYSTIKAVVERPFLWAVYVNGNKIKNNPDEWWLDRGWGVYDLGAYLKKGRNVISIQMYPMSVYAELEQIFIIGDFSLKAATKGWEIVSPTKPHLGSWKEQGYPFYYTDFSYIHNYNIRNNKSRYVVELSHWEGTVAEVIVNGNSAGILFVEPYRLDISSYVVPGNNEIEVKITGSLKNLLGPFHSEAKLGRATPTYWRNSGSYPPGCEYNLLNYGLMEDFVLIEK